jgi:hypothetical protein
MLLDVTQQHAYAIPLKFQECPYMRIMIVACSGPTFYLDVKFLL